MNWVVSQRSGGGYRLGCELFGGGGGEFEGRGLGVVRRVALVLPDRAGDKVLSYELGPGMEVEAGARVRVPLRSRSVLGTVLEVRWEAVDGGVDLKRVEAVVGGGVLIRPELMGLAKWVAEYYCCSLEAALACVLPQPVRDGSVGPRDLVHARILRQPSEEELGALERRAPRRAELLRRLAGRAGGVASLAELKAEMSGAEEAARGLAGLGWVELKKVEVPRDPFGGERFVATRDLELNEEQALALEKIWSAVAGGREARPILLFGVTGSGKTEVYLQAIRKVVGAGKMALVLVPEISLTPQTVERFKARFAENPGMVAVLHSRLSAGERRDEWNRIARGEARIVIGARSAVFAPLERPGLMIVDEEHEPSYKQEEAPRYHARDVAVMRGWREGCAVVLGSATPSLESWQNVLSGKYELAELRQRVDSRRMPHFKVLDMRRAKGGGDGLLSPALKLAIGERLERKEQVILFLNRRGYSSSMQCPACGSVRQCRNCSVAMTYHREAGKLICHICGHTEVAPTRCPECGDEGILFFGAGTQRVEETVRRFFPLARVARMDADAMARKDACREVLGAFRRGEIDILVGTQMIAKGLDFPNVTLVGIINADIGLHVADFRAGERTFQLLTQVAGRSGRGEAEGEVFIQTWTPHSPSIQFARHHDFRGFAEQELEFRRAFGFPPYMRMILVGVRSESLEKAEFCARTLARKLKEGLPDGANCGEGVPAPIARIKQQYRFQVLVRGPRARDLVAHVRGVVGRVSVPEDVFLSIDVDAVHLL